MAPDLRDGCHVEIYGDPNLMEVFVNDGEYVISNVVYGLGQEIITKNQKNFKIFTTRE